jgi:hypothetical protein
MLPGKVIPFADPSQKISPRGALSQIVVQIGRDRELLRLRAKVIRTAGYTVHSISPDEAIADVLKLSGGKVWVFCHTLEVYELALLAVAVRNSCPSDRLLRLTGLDYIQQPKELFDDLLAAVHGVDELLQGIDRLAGQLTLSR